MDACILAYTRLPQQVSPGLLARCAAALPYGRRLRLRGSERVQWQSLAGLGLACRLLQRATGRAVQAAQLQCPRGAAPYLPGGPAFSIAHAGEWVACVLAPAGAVGLDIELLAARAPFGTLAGWVAREAVAKAAGVGLAGVRAVRLVRATGRTQPPGWAQLNGRRWQLLAPRQPLPCVLRVALERPARALHTLRVPFEHVCSALTAMSAVCATPAGATPAGQARAA